MTDGGHQRTFEGAGKPGNWGALAVLDRPRGDVYRPHRTRAGRTAFALKLLSEAPHL